MGGNTGLQRTLGDSRRRLERCDELALIAAAQRGDEAASSVLVSRYRGFVRCKARSYFLAGADRDDVIQEGMIGLYKAIRDYDPSRQASFRSFAELCITRQLITAIKSATRQKHSPLNSYVSLSRSTSAEEEGDRVLADILAAREMCDPAEIVIAAWETVSIREGFMQVLSPFETEVLRLYIAGKSYQEVAESLDRGVKSVDNALQRIKRKIELQIELCRAC
ncbi:MAG TPA: RNA polymerase sporulation sigma factor SigH [Coriobacteriia bacterium]|nr:RNA polymerase sporulation sigma factor SigH [Coriobacteriia bacterium]